MEKFIIVKDALKQVRKYKLTGRTMEFKISPIPKNVEPVGWVRGALDEIIKKSTDHLQLEDQVGITFCSKEFKRGPGYMKFKNASQLTTDDVWAIINGVFQSNSTGLNTDTFCLSVTSVRMPKGRGRGSCYNTFNEECARRKGIITINNRDNLCLPRALVVAIAHTEKDPKFMEVRRDIRKEQTLRTETLVISAGVEIPEEGSSIEELQSFQTCLKEYKITVYQYGNKGRYLLFEGPENTKKINLLYHKGHFNVITSLTAAFCCSYYCEQCHVPYNSKNEHRCGGTCQACRGSPACHQAMPVKCPKCCRKFRSKQCFNQHMKFKSFDNNKSVCEALRLCEMCLKTVKVDREHFCGEIFCKVCKKHMPQDHLCYMQPDTRTPKLKDFLFVFYDLESRQETKMANGDLLHEPNLCVFKTCCEHCINSTDSKCEKCGERMKISLYEEKYNYLNHSPVEWMLNYILGRRKLYKHIVVVAHNGQAYDHQFVLNHILTKTDLKPELIMRGTKIVQMLLENVKFIDSLNFFPMALSALPKAFGLGDTFKKGYFPHLFNTKANESYVGSLPPSKYFSPDTMKTKARDEFILWYNKNKNFEFNLKKELVEYCISDVEILTAACLKFRELLLQAGNVCPLTEACTIASACNKVYRRNFLQSNTIGIIPKGGYRWRDNQSIIATKWLLWEEKQRAIDIVHTAKEKEAIVSGVKVDGFCKETNQVFEFHGCYYHGCPHCFKYDRDTPLHDNPEETLNSRYEATAAKTERLKNLNNEVVEIWECNFRRKMGENSLIGQFSNQHPVLVNIPLNPRDGFYGGRTGNTKTIYSCKEGEKIKYVDVCSLYPWACKYGKFPIGHPEVIVGHNECLKVDLISVSGLIKCSILPPQDLFHPVLPVKLNNKLMFVLCQMCGEYMNQSMECNHTEVERILHGTWVIEEVAKALEKGYVIHEIQEIWKYQTCQYDRSTRTGGLFAEMMNKFIKYKQEASDWPKSKSTKEERNAYIKQFLQEEGVRLEFINIVNNPGLRSLAKLMLNSFWGKLGQRENQPKTAIVTKSEVLFALIANPSIDVNGVLPVNEEVVLVNYKFIEEAYDPLSTVNVTLAAYTTAHARLKLYSYLEQLGERALYYDTDSVIYIAREGEYDVPLGDFIGQITDELGPKYGEGSFITQFASGGPKNYGYEVNGDKGKVSEAKVKGISLNYTTSKLIKFEKIASMILEDSEPVYVVTTNIRRTADHKVVTCEEKKLYKPKSTKRRFTGHDSVPYGYKRPKDL